MVQDQTDEVDLVYVIKKIKQIVNKWIVLLFKALSYCLKYWYVILILILVGLTLGYFKNQSAVIPQKSKVLARVNYEMPNHVFNAIDVLNAKIRDGDSTFLSQMGLKWYNPEIKEVKMEPVVNFNDILEKHEMNNRNLDMLLKNVNFEGEEIPLSDMFIPEYNYFILDVTLTDQGSKKDVQTLIDYLNSNDDLKAYKEASFKNLESTIAHNNKSLTQIDNVLDSYVVLESSRPLDNLLYVDKDLDLNRLLEAKLEIQKNNEKLKNEYMLSSDIVVPVDKINLTLAQRGIMSKKMLIYPIFLVFLFMFLSYARYVFFYLKRIAEENS